MTLDPHAVPPANRRAVWIVAGLCAVSLVFVGRAQQAGAPFRWTSWALPVLILANVVMPSLGAYCRRRVVRWAYTGASVGVASAVIWSLVVARI